jgi:hypothetical protein
MWNTLNRNILAMLHPEEMVAPAESANLIRAMGSRPIDRLPGMRAANLSSAPTGGGKTIIFQVGDEVLGEITDHAMYEQETMYGSRGVSRVGGSAR